MSKTKTPRVIADVSGGTILATVEIGVPPERVFRALASEEIVHWWGSDELYRTTAWTGDVRVGGAWRATGVSSDGKPFTVTGKYLEVDPPNKLVHTWAPEWAPGEPTTVTYRLEAIENGTRLTLRHEGFGDRHEVCASHASGWERVLGWLKTYGDPPAKRETFLLRLVPPRPSFPTDMSEAERRVMGEHVMYWTKQLEAGVAIAFGPVLDPKGAWGAGIVEVDDVAALRPLQENDPAMKSGLGFQYEIMPMPGAIVRA